MGNAFRSRCSVGVILCLVAASAGCGVRRTHNPQHPDVLFITLDTLRADHCSAYGYGKPTTPEMEKFAAQGVLFEETYCPMPTTGPAHATMFTSLAPLAHGFAKNGQLLREEFVTLAEVLRDNGYRTGAVVSSFAVHGKFGLAQGFNDYNDDFGTKRGEFRATRWEGHPVPGAFDQDAVVTTKEAVAWLRANSDDAEPLFLWVHYFDPHWPYHPPAPYDTMFPADKDDPVAHSLAAYDGEIRETDDAVARLLEHVDDETLVIMVGDHGEEFMQHGWAWHDLHLYEESVRVPLVVRWPGHLPAGLRLRGPVELADLMPTLLDLLGLRLLPGMTGISLVPAMRDGAALAPDREIFLQRRQYKSGLEGRFRVEGDKSAVRSGSLKYIEAQAENSYELYDLATDPGERANLVSRRRADAERLAASLRAWRESAPAVTHEQTVEPADAEKLRSLGYVQ
ncbi:MAG: sulfatase [Acidobacteria bacterium]|nr:sulfatase [Acidobacteriota bacterium]